MRFGLHDSVISRIIEILRENPAVEEAILYGSRAKGSYKPGSDIDLVLKGEKLNIEKLNKISLALDDLLLPYAFDLSILDRIDDPDLLGHIERVGKLFYRRTDV